MSYIRQLSGWCGSYDRLTLQSANVIIVPYRIMWNWYAGRWWVG